MNVLKIPTRPTNQLAIYTVRPGVELGTTENKSSWWQLEGFQPETSRFQDPLSAAAEPV